MGAGRVSASYSRALVTAGPWSQQGFGHSRALVTSGPWVLSLQGLGHIRALVLVTAGSYPWSQHGLEPCHSLAVYMILCGWAPCLRALFLGDTVPDSAGLQSQTHCVHRLKQGVHCPRHPGRDSPRHPGRDSPRHPGIDSPRHPGIDSPRHPSPAWVWELPCSLGQGLVEQGDG